MGIHDTYHVPLDCPIDGVRHETFSGHEGTGHTFRIGSAEPEEAAEGHRLLAGGGGPEAYVAGLSDAPIARGLPLSDRDLGMLRYAAAVGATELRLPAAFLFDAPCGDHILEGVGETDPSGTFARARIVCVTYARAGGGRAIELARAGALLPEGIAVWRADRAAAAARLAAGGVACGWNGHRDGAPPPAVAYLGGLWCSSDGFLCAACAERCEESMRTGFAASLIRAGQPEGSTGDDLRR